MNYHGTCVNFGNERRSGNDVLVEGDVDDVIGGLQRHEADGEPGRPLGVHLRRDVPASGGRECIRILFAHHNLAICIWQCTHHYQNHAR